MNKVGILSEMRRRHRFLADLIAQNDKPQAPVAREPPTDLELFRREVEALEKVIPFVELRYPEDA